MSLRKNNKNSAQTGHGKPQGHAVYELPILTVYRFSVEDVLCTSTTAGTGGTQGGDGPEETTHPRPSFKLYDN